MELSSRAQEIAQSRYLMEGENWEGLCRRVGACLANNETSDRQKWASLFSEIIYNMEFIPGGRVLRNAGRLKGELANCFVIPIEDSIEAIGDYIRNSLVCWAGGGGVGSTFSTLRPKGFAIKGKGGRSSGLVSFLEAADKVASTIESGGARRAAGIAICSVEHPDVLDFINAKLIDKRISHFNISVAVNSEFLDAVEKNEPWKFHFLQQFTQEMPARDLWNLILSNMINCGEPGLVNWDNLQKNNSFYYNKPISTNPCSEAVLGAFESCILGSVVLPSFLSGTVTNWKKLCQTLEVAVRMLDNVIDVNNFSVPLIETNSKRGRRIGIGVMGLADYFFKKGIRYGSEQSLLEVERLARFMRDTIYRASVKIAIEKGPFPAFDSSAYSKASFVRKLPAQIRADIKKHGTRNVTTLAIAPTGTISLLPEVCSSIEPLYAKAYMRNDRVSSRAYIHPLALDVVKSGGKIPEWLVDSFDLTTEDHLEIQVAFQKYVDGGVSKTINCPNDMTVEKLSSLMLEYLYDIKGFTLYRDGSREGQVLNKIADDKIVDYLGAESLVDERSVKCLTGVCEL